MEDTGVHEIVCACPSEVGFSGFDALKVTQYHSGGVLWKVELISRQTCNDDVGSGGPTVAHTSTVLLHFSNVT